MKSQTTLERITECILIREFFRQLADVDTVDKRISIVEAYGATFGKQNTDTTQETEDDEFTFNTKPKEDDKEVDYVNGKLLVHTPTANYRDQLSPDEIQAELYNCQKTNERLQPFREYIPEDERSAGAFRTGSSLGEEELQTIQDQYARMAERAGIAPTNLEAHVGGGNAVVFNPTDTQDYLVGQFIGTVFAVSHFAPENPRSGVLMLYGVRNGSVPVVFAVPDWLASQLERIGFKKSKMLIPMEFRGETQMKHVLLSNAVTDKDFEQLKEWYSAYMRQWEYSATNTLRRQKTLQQPKKMHQLT